MPSTGKPFSCAAMIGFIRSIACGPKDADTGKSEAVTSDKTTRLRMVPPAPCRYHVPGESGRGIPRSSAATVDTRPADRSDPAHLFCSAARDAALEAGRILITVDFDVLPPSRPRRARRRRARD
jgi:hypothetical protein